MERANPAALHNEPDITVLTDTNAELSQSIAGISENIEDIASEDEELVLLNGIVDQDAIIFDEGRAITINSIWGRLVTHLRNNGPQNLFSIVSEIRDIDVSEGRLVISAGEKEYSALNQYIETISDILKLQNAGLTPLIVKREDSDEKTYLDEVKKIKNLLGNIPFRILEKK